MTIGSDDLLGTPIGWLVARSPSRAATSDAPALAIASYEITQEVAPYTEKIAAWIDRVDLYTEYVARHGEPLSRQTEHSAAHADRVDNRTERPSLCTELAASHL